MRFCKLSKSQHAKAKRALREFAVLGSKLPRGIVTTLLWQNLPSAREREDSMPSPLKDHTDFWGAVATFGDYKPYGVHKADGGEWTNYPEHSGNILSLKKGKEWAIRHFAEMIEPELPNDIGIVTVPSTRKRARHDHNAGIHELACDQFSCGDPRVRDIACADDGNGRAFQ
jgi:hypothetical protein